MQAAQLSAKGGLSRIAKDMWQQVVPDTKPRTVTTLGDVADALATSAKTKDGSVRRSAKLTLVIADTEACEPKRFAALLQALAAARQHGLAACLVLGVATNPTLLLPNMPARASGLMAVCLFKLPTPRATLQQAVHTLQVRFPVSLHTSELQSMCACAHDLFL